MVLEFPHIGPPLGFGIGKDIANFLQNDGLYVVPFDGFNLQ